MATMETQATDTKCYVGGETSLEKSRCNTEKEMGDNMKMNHRKSCDNG
jgi:hypothetical protein